MKIRNTYGIVPKDKLGRPRLTWWVVEEEPGIAVTGDDHVYHFESQAEAEQVAETLAAQTDSQLTVVRYSRHGYASFQRRSTVERSD